MELVDLGLQKDTDLQLPPVLLGILGKDPAKKTVSEHHYQVSTLL